MNCAFQPEALAEYEEATRHFAGIRGELAARFVASVEETVARILQSPSSYRRFEGDIRRCMTRVFPYAVLYAIEPDGVLIVAVMHCRREPGCWRNRVPQGVLSKPGES